MQIACECQYCKDITEVTSNSTTSRPSQTDTDRTSRRLEEMIKKLHCLHHISKIVDESSGIDGTMQKIAECVPPAMGETGKSCACIRLFKKTYRAGGDCRGQCRLTAAITIENQEAGSLSFGQAACGPSAEEGKAYTEEENFLIETIAERVGKIFQRTLAEQKVRENENQLKTLFNNLAEGILIIAGDHCLFANRAAIETLGVRDEKELIGQNFLPFLLADDAANFIQTCNHIVTDPGAVKTLHYRIRRPDDSVIWAESRLSGIGLKSGFSSLLTLRDITKRKIQEIQNDEALRVLKTENNKLRSSLKDRYRFHNIIGMSESMQAVYEMIMRASMTDANVVIYGESGTGKDLVARAIHDLSDRKDHTIVPINCRAIPGTLIESEFFGYRKGAFSGATIDKLGYLEIADRGTLFIDEIGEIELDLQIKLLRAIEGGGFTPLGACDVVKPDIRIIAATHRDLKQQVEKGRIREDFYYRLHVVPIHLPPLRERKEDLPLLIRHFLTRFRKTGGIRSLPTRVMDQLNAYDFPGNVRELQNLLQRYLTVGEIELPVTFTDRENQKHTGKEFGQVNKDETLKLATARFERWYIDNLLQRFGGNRTHCARALQVGRRTLQRKIQQHHIDTMPPAAQCVTGDAPG